MLTVVKICVYMQEALNVMHDMDGVIPQLLAINDEKLEHKINSYIPNIHYSRTNSTGYMKHYSTCLFTKTEEL